MQTASLRRIGIHLENLLKLARLGGVVTYDRTSGQETAVKFASYDGRLHKDILLTQLFALNGQVR